MSPTPVRGSASVKTTERGAIEVDERGSTNVDGVWAIGDVTGKLMLAHTAEAMGIVTAETIAGHDTIEIDFSRNGKVTEPLPEDLQDDSERIVQTMISTVRPWSGPTPSEQALTERQLHEQKQKVLQVVKRLADAEGHRPAPGRLGRCRGRPCGLLGQ